MSGLDELRKLHEQLQKHIDALAADEGAPAEPEGLTREQLSKMTPDEINARWDEVARLLERGA